MRHALGVLGVLAAGVLLAVSAAMNWRFGYHLGQSEVDGQILGAASAAADCLKALIPFFFFAALRNRQWSQAVAALVVGLVVTGYSLTSALGFAAEKRMQNAGERAQQAQVYQDLRADLKHSQDELGWIPQHRPVATIQNDLESVKGQKAWGWTKSCTDTTDASGRKFCDKFHALSAEVAAAQQSLVVEAKITDLQGKLGKFGGMAAVAEVDPQATVLAHLTGLDVAHVQTAMAIFVAILLEIGSGFGMFVAFSQWRIDERPAERVTRVVTVSAPANDTAAAAVAAQKEAVASVHKPHSGANDNKSAPAQRLIAPENDVERYYKERIETQDGSTVTATEMYEDYCAWCETKEKEPLALPTFSRQFGDLGVQKSKIAGRVRYIGIAIRSTSHAEDKKQLVFGSVAA
jgi:hypothetical protein